MVRIGQRTGPWVLFICFAFTNVVVACDAEPDEDTDDPVDPGPMIVKVPNPDLVPRSRFGEYMQEDGDKLLVGAAGDFHDFTDSAGAVYVFDAEGAMIRRIDSPSPDPYDFFGWGIGVFPSEDGTMYAIGSQQDDVTHDTTVVNDAGSVFLVDGETGAHVRTFQSPEPGAGAGFGVEVANVRGKVATAEWDGDIRVFDPSTGALVYSIEYPAPEGRFTHFASIQGNIVSGASPADEGRGKVYVFDGGSGTLLGEIPTPQPDDVHEFGFTIEESDGDILASALGSDGVAGAVYVLDGDPDSGTFGQVVLRLSNPGRWENGFGYYMQAVGETIAVSAIFGGFPSGAGVVYLFDASSGTLLEQLDNPDPEHGDFFGYWMGDLDGRLAIGASGDDPPDAEGNPVLNAGSMYLVDLDQLLADSD
jgi:hypothetical protein